VKRSYIDRIPVPGSEVVAEQTWAACSWVAMFIDQAIQRGYERDELPYDAVRFDDLWEYRGEVRNGGHAQYYENEIESRPRLAQTADLLGDIGLPNHRDLLIDFDRFVVENEYEIEEIYISGDSQAGKEMFYGFDDRFYELEESEGNLEDCLRKWLLRQPWIVVEDDQEIADMTRLKRSIPNHPFQEERLAARLRQ